MLANASVTLLHYLLQVPSLLGPVGVATLVLPLWPTESSPLVDLPPRHAPLTPALPLCLPVAPLLPPQLLSLSFLDSEDSAAPTTNPLEMINGPLPPAHETAGAVLRRRMTLSGLSPGCKLALLGPVAY